MGSLPRCFTFRYLSLSLLSVVVSISISVSAFVQASSRDELTVLIPADVQKDVRLFLALAGRDILEVKNFSGPYGRRDVAEIILFYQALYLGGYRGRIRELLVPVGSYAKVGVMLRQGRVALVGNTAWLVAINAQDADIWVTAALIKDGEFSAGIYTRADRVQSLKSQLLHQRDRLSAVSTQYWPVDWRELQRLNLRHVYEREKWRDMVSMVTAGKVDFLLAPFKRPLTEGMDVGEQHLYPVEGVKLTLPGSRHWVASKRHPMGGVGFVFLQRGLRALQKLGRIKRAYQQVGFITTEVENWIDLYQPPKKEPAPQE